MSRRLQVAPSLPGVSAPTFSSVLTSLLREGGPAALYRGLGAATLRVVPMAVVSFGTYELVRGAVVKWELEQDAAALRAQCRQQAQAHARAGGAGVAACTAPAGPVGACGDGGGQIAAASGGSGSGSSNSGNNGSSCSSSCCCGGSSDGQVAAAAVASRSGADAAVAAGAQAQSAGAEAASSSACALQPLLAGAAPAPLLPGGVGVEIAVVAGGCGAAVLPVTPLIVDAAATPTTRPR